MWRPKDARGRVVAVTLVVTQRLAEPDGPGYSPVFGNRNLIGHGRRLACWPGLSETKHVYPPQNEHGIPTVAGANKNLADTPVYLQ